MMPIGGCRTAEIGENLFDRDILRINIAADRAAEGLKPIITTGKLVAHGLPEGDIAGDQIAEFYRSPPRSNSATSRSPARSTLA